MIGVASLNRCRLLPELVKGEPACDELSTAFRKGARERWLDVESGRRPPPQPEP